MESLEATDQYAAAYPAWNKPACSDRCRLSTPATKELRPLALACSTREQIRRVEVPVARKRSATWEGAAAELLTVTRSGQCELEFLLPSHVVMTHPEGTASGCEWSDGSETRKLTALPPRSVLFNPAGR